MMIIVPLLSENINAKKIKIRAVYCLLFNYEEDQKKTCVQFFECLIIVCQLFVLANKEGANVLHWSVMGGWCAESHLGQNEHLT